MAHPKHEDVRRRFDGRCAYCGIAEVESGGELTVDHFHPQSAGGDDTDDNLVYACFRCNLFKADFVPSADDLSHGRRLLHPLRDDPNQHCLTNPHTGELEPLTETGRFHITLLHLNRPALVTHRLRQRLRNLELTRLRMLEEEIEQLRRLVVAQAEYVADLRRALGLSP